MHTILLQFLLSLAVYTVLDVVWFMLILQPFFFDSMVHLLNIRHDHVELRWFPAVLVYIFLSLGLIVFVLPPSALLFGIPVVVRGALFGLVVYGVYETTNGALLHRWPVSLMITDIVWGIFSSAITAFVVTSMLPASLFY
jgi:uncharacterized membrane protein